LRRGLTKSLAPSASFETYADLVSRLRLDCSLRRKSVQATNANASSSSLWLTPDVPNGGRGLAEGTTLTGHRPDGRKAQVGLQNQAKIWPTPTANDWKGSGPTLERADGQMRGDRLDYATEQLWSTPTAHDGRRPGPDLHSTQGNNLSRDAALWNTPRATDGEKMGGRSKLRIEQGKPAETLTEQSKEFSLPDLAISTVGDGSLHIRRTLNPLFVEWLMGWPPGWTSVGLTPPASTVSACSATALSAWKQRMRSALLSLGSPIKAPPAQLSFVI